jgi:hypothetical protein
VCALVYFLQELMHVFEASHNVYECVRGRERVKEGEGKGAGGGGEYVCALVYFLEELMHVFEASLETVEREWICVCKRNGDGCL